MLLAVDHATNLDNLVPATIEGKTKTRFEWFDGVNPWWAKELRPFGLAGTVTNKSRDVNSKGPNRGTMCMFVGFSAKHPTATYKMWNR